MKLLKKIISLTLFTITSALGSDNFSLTTIGGYSFGLGQTYQGRLSYKSLENSHTKDLYFDSFTKGYSFRAALNYNITENLVVDIESGLISSSDFSYSYIELRDYNFVTLNRNYVYTHIPILMHFKMEIGEKHKLYSGIGFGTMLSNLRIEITNDFDTSSKEAILYPKLPFVSEGLIGFSYSLNDNIFLVSEIRFLMTNFVIEKQKEDAFYYSGLGSYSGKVTYTYDRNNPNKLAEPIIGGNSFSLNIGFGFWL
ncbi:MAG: hypothetical protein D8M58_05630 [Calditrichaeota bacterium]|nr:MAG: hypothetical protein DWQ03_20875 [Calditrichota bacterium]MBL1204857.1 hypothetical protein [Calditrichota bacterium]NOG44686.1 hypothetical protein [Calditrichota bacterium]